MRDPHDIPLDREPHQGARVVLSGLLVLLYVTAGVIHIVSPDAFVTITPDWVPYPRQLIVATGVCEIVGALGLMVPRLRKLAGIMLALYAVCVFPANIKHAFMHVQAGGIPDSWWYHGPRLAMQPVLVWAALFCTNVVTWPFRGAQRP